MCICWLNIIEIYTMYSTRYIKTLSLRSPLNVGDQALHTYKTTGKIIVLYILALTSPTGGGRSVGIVRSRTKAREYILIYMFLDSKM